MENLQDIHFRPRRRISAQIQLDTALHIGSGETYPRILDTEQKEEVQVSAVITDHRNNPYIPGSSLRGLLRDIMKRSDCEKAEFHKLFGTHTKELERGGKLMVANSYLNRHASEKPELTHVLAVEGLPRQRRWWDNERWTWIVNGVSLNRFTRTASEHRLFHYEVVPPGAVFNLTIDGIGLTEEELGWILTILNDFSKPGSMLLGKGRALGYGRCRIIGTPVVTGLETAAQLCDWLDQKDTTGLQKFPTRITATPKQQHTGIYQASAAETCTFHLSLSFDGPFLIKDPSSCFTGKGDEDIGLSHVYLSDHENRIFLPGRSFKGAFRSQVEKIARTMLDYRYKTTPSPKILQKAACYPTSADLSCPDINHYDDLDKCCPACRLCGGKGYRSPLTVSDFTAEEEGRLRKQEFVAIDRFTGGAAVNKKFNALHREYPVLTGTVSLDLSRLHNAHIGLFALALRDLLEGDISFGFGRSKGFGRCTAVVTRVSPPATWPKTMSREEEGGWAARIFLEACKKHSQPFTDDDCRLSTAALVQHLEEHFEKIAAGA